MLKRSKKIGLFLVSLLIVGEVYQLTTEHTSFTSAIANLAFNNNFHEVTPGEFYRSAEMRYPELRASIKEHGIKTVIDLRWDPDTAGVAEREVVIESGARYEHVPLIGSRLPTNATLEKLLSAYRNSPKPILVHCDSGTHRSGVASTIWLLEEKHEDVKIASQQLSRKFGFFRWERALKSLISGKPTIDNLIWAFQARHQANGEDFETFLKSKDASTR